MLEIDLALPHAYAVEEMGDLPGTGNFAVPLIFFPPPKSRLAHDGLWLKVTAASGKRWIGVFKFGYSSPPAFSCVVDSLDPNRMCVISKGAAYIVKADKPEAWEQIPLVPVLDFRVIPDAGLLIFSDSTRLMAYGSSGLAWRSPRVCWDGLKIVSVNRGIIEGIGYDPTNLVTHESRFAVDLKTGRSLLTSPSSIDGEPLW
ncbi:MAG: hypothetical protein ABSA59_01975 [Terriglobia bacterium]|jgi:hypothetical protein